MKTSKILSLILTAALLFAVPVFTAYAKTEDSSVVHQAADDLQDEQTAEDTTQENQESTTEPVTKPSATEPETTEPETTEPTTVYQIKSIKLTKGDMTIGLNETAQVTVSDQNGKNVAVTDVTFSTSNSSIVSVDAKGNIKGKKLGTATITAKTKNGKKATCKVTVKSAPTSIKLNITSATIGIGEKSVDLNSSVSGGYSRCRKYTSSNTKIATVDTQGIVTGIKEGTATITCTTYNGKKATCKITVGKAPTGIKLNITSASIGVGEKSVDLDSTVTGGSSRYRKYTSSNTKIATVDKSGIVTGIKEGTATITCTTYNGLEATCKITVGKAPTGIKLNITSASIGVGEKSVDLNSTVTGGSSRYRKYTSSNTKIATVDKSGIVTGVKEGTATITCTTYNGKKATCKITVGKKPTSIKLNITSASIGVGEKSVDLNSTVSGGYSRYRKYTSSNTNIATVDKSGIVTGVKEGTATITCTTYNGKKATCKITVGKKPTSIKITNSNSIIQKNSNNHKVTYSLSSGARSYKITYSIQDKSIATVNSSGYITGLKNGKTTLTVKTYNGLTATQQITVKDDSLSLNVNSTQIALDNKNVEKIKYGKSVQGRNLEGFVITNNGKYKKTLFIDFAIHGFEDEYYRDGQVLVKEANALINYFAGHTSELGDYRLVIVPCANPDGTIAGTNNQRACSTAFGRCTAKHVDMNRDWTSFSAVETRNLRDFISKMKPSIYLNMHGWLNETIGDSTLNGIINKQLGLKDRLDNRYPSAYAIGWVHNNLKIPAVLVEYKSSKDVSTTKDIKMIKAVIASGNSSSSSARKFPAAVNWKNGSTVEPVYKVSNLTDKIDTLSARKSAKCYRKSGNSYVIVYDYGSGKHKAGFVKYAGGVKSAPTAYKTYRNNSTSEKVYADTSKKTSVGSLDPNETCYCLGKIDGMYLVVYNVNGTSRQKCGFVSYSGGC